ncbi:hypothetical protein [Bradyrhizobium centrosematis]|uniref:hypothetical protein n=1 Tax=Bradyrhizobium centrosematis TaxID=1300039 RepID=UPI00388E7EDB
MPLAEFYDQFRTLKYVVRKQLIESPRLIQKPNTAILDLRQFDCPDIDNTLFIEDEVDIQIEKDFASGRKPRARTDFLIMPAQAGWLSLRIGGRPLPAPATAAAFGNEKGASLVFSQHELDGSVIALST